jgi:hypothetical protein
MQQAQDVLDLSSPDDSPDAPDAVMSDCSFKYLAMSGFEHTHVSRGLVGELLGYEVPVERVWVEGETVVVEVRDSREAREVMDGFLHVGAKGSRWKGDDGMRMVTGEVITFEVLDTYNPEEYGSQNSSRPINNFHKK